MILGHEEDNPNADTGGGTVAVHLGPEWYIERLDGKLAKGDAVEVKGSRVTFAGNPAIIAAEVKKGDAVLKLRDDKREIYIDSG